MIGKDKLAFNAFWWDHLKDDDAVRGVVDTLAEIGYKGVEWKETCFNREANICDSLKKAVRISNEGGLAVTDAVILRSLTNPETSKKSVEDVSNFIRACAGAGIDKVNIPNGNPSVGKPVIDEWWAPAYSPAKLSWDTLRASLEAILKVASDYKVYLVLESVAGQLVHDYFTTREMFNMIDSPYLYLTMDPSHYQLYRNDIPWAVRKLGTDKIKHVHLKDSIGVPGDIGADFLFPLLGEGAVDWNGFFLALDDISYDGYLSVEFESWKYMRDVLGGNPAEAARISMKSACALLDKYKAG